MSQTPGATIPALAALNFQRSHLLLVLSNSLPNEEQAFKLWYVGTCRDAMLQRPDVLRAVHMVADEVDVTGGLFPAPAFRYVAIYELTLDGAEAGAEAIANIRELHAGSGVSSEISTWLYFPLGEPVGIPAPDCSSYTLAFANGLPDQDCAFREWYATRHIRHALNIPAISGSQCFERTLFQDPGAQAADFHIIAVYEQTGTATEIIEAFSALSPETIAFPALDLTRFGEASYRVLAK